MNTEIEPVTLDLIRRLKREGQTIEATRLHNAYLKNLRQQRKEDKKAMRSIENKIYRIKRYKQTITHNTQKV